MTDHISDERLSSIEQDALLWGERYPIATLGVRDLTLIIARLRAAEAVIECTPVIPWEYDSEAHAGAYLTWIASKGGGK